MSISHSWKIPVYHWGLRLWLAVQGHMTSGTWALSPIDGLTQAPKGSSSVNQLCMRPEKRKSFFIDLGGIIYFINCGMLDTWHKETNWRSNKENGGWRYLEMDSHEGNSWEVWRGWSCFPLRFQSFEIRMMMMIIIIIYFIMMPIYVR